jgi:hypothetical protein
MGTLVNNLHITHIDLLEVLQEGGKGLPKAEKHRQTDLGFPK